LTLYVHDGGRNGPVIPSTQVTGHDGSGNNFQQTTDSNGYATITGDTGTWSFSASASGYETNNWDQEITETDTKDAYLMKSAAFVSQGSGNNVVGKWAFHVESECAVSNIETTASNASDAAVDFFNDGSGNSILDSVIEFHSDGTLTNPENDDLEIEAKWVQSGDTIRLQFNPISSQIEDGGSGSLQHEGIWEGTIKGDMMSGTGSFLTHMNFTDYSDFFTADITCSIRWSGSRVDVGS
jgi:hypothetical protein